MMITQHKLDLEFGVKGVCCKDFGENWSRCNATTMYIILNQNPEFNKTTMLLVIPEACHKYTVHRISPLSHKLTAYRISSSGTDVLVSMTLGTWFINWKEGISQIVVKPRNWVSKWLFFSGIQWVVLHNDITETPAKYYVDLGTLSDKRVIQHENLCWHISNITYHSTSALSFYIDVVLILSIWTEVLGSAHIWQAI